MDTKYPRDFEHFSSETKRLKVVGGWLVIHLWDRGPAMCFVPDQFHQWVLEDKKQ